MAIQGILLGLVWSERKPQVAVTEPAESPPRRRTAWWAIEVPVALGLALVAAWAAARGAQQLSAQEVRYPAAVLGATLISATLMLPMISIGTPLAAEGRAWIPLKAQAGVVFLNLGVLAPLILLITRAAGRLERLSLATTRPVDEELIFPRMAWRIDSVTLLILSLLFVPAAAGRLRLDRWVGGCLVAAYFIYLVVTLSLGPL